jgi:hypothetical protein
MLLIPTFEVGQRVKIEVRPTESLCRSCGHIEGTDWSGRILDGIILEATPFIRCSTCGDLRPWLEGYYAVKLTEGERAIPYTLIEPTEEAL